MLTAIGEWYGPSTAAHVLKDLASIHRRIFRGHLEVCVAQGGSLSDLCFWALIILVYNYFTYTSDGIVYKSEIERICTGEVAAPSHYSSSNSLSGSIASTV